MNLTSETYFNQRKIKILFLIVLFISTIIPTILAIIYAPINCDSGYFLSIVNRISDGYIPYKDVALGYTPLVLYLIYIYKNLFFFIDSYELFLTIHFIFVYLCAFLIYKISFRFTKRYYISLFAAWLFFITAFRFQSDVILLEIPSIFFGLLACELALKYSTRSIQFLFIGIIASFSFWSKQYGLGFIPLIIILIITFGSYKLKQSLYLIVGFVLTLLMCYFIWPDCFFGIYGGYGSDEIASNHYKNNYLRAIPWAIITFTKSIFPNLLFILYIPLYYKNNKNDWGIYAFLIAGISGFLLQFYFHNTRNYFLYILPFAIILSFYILLKLNFLSKIVRYSYWIILSTIIVITIKSTYYDIVYTSYIISDKKDNQFRLANNINKIVKNKNSKLYVYNVDLAQQYYLTNLLPPLYKGKIDYSFGPLVENEKIKLMKIESADYILKINYDNKWEKNYEKIESLLKTYKCSKISSDVFLYHNTKNY